MTFDELKRNSWIVNNYYMSIKYVYTPQVRWFLKVHQESTFTVHEVRVLLTWSVPQHVGVTHVRVCLWSLMLFDRITLHPGPFQGNCNGLDYMSGISHVAPEGFISSHVVFDVGQ